MIQSHRRRGVLLAAGLLFATPASAFAAPSVSVTGDGGAPVPIGAGQTVTIRNMAPQVAVTFPPGDGRFKLTLTNQAGQAASSASGFCFRQSTGDTQRIGYQGNQTYVATVTEYAADDAACATPVTSSTFNVAIAASVAIMPPAGPFAFRQPRSFMTTPYEVTVAGNPGADDTQIQFALNGVVGPDGALTGMPERATADATGRARLFLTKAGAYTIVARARKFVGAGEAGSPWSAPVRLVVKSPFDFRAGLDFVDRRGPSYAVRATLRDAGARGKVSVSLARGTRGGKYRSIGSATISSKGTITKRFRVSKLGRYRLRFTFKGSEFGQAGRVVEAIEFRRSFF